MNVLSKEKQIQVITVLVEGMLHELLANFPAALIVRHKSAPVIE